MSRGSSPEREFHLRTFPSLFKSSAWKSKLKNASERRVVRVDDGKRPRSVLETTENEISENPITRRSYHSGKLSTKLCSLEYPWYSKQRIENCSNTKKINGTHSKKCKSNRAHISSDIWSMEVNCFSMWTKCLMKYEWEIRVEVLPELCSSQQDLRLTTTFDRFS